MRRIVEGRRARRREDEPTEAVHGPRPTGDDPEPDPAVRSRQPPGGEEHLRDADVRTSDAQVDRLRAELADELGRLAGRRGVGRAGGE